MTQHGWVLPSNHIGTDPDDIVRWACEVERLGFSYLDIFDHVVGADITDRPDWPGPYTVAHEFHEPFVLFAFLAAHTNLDLATGVLVLPQRQTALVAKQAAELDLLSRGRLRLGVGIGWNPVEHEALGLRFEDRAARYEEQIAVLRRLWTEPSITVVTDHHRIDRAGMAPRPGRSIPIWMGGGAARRVLERIGRVGDGWIVHDPHPGEALDAALKVVRSAAREAGRDPASIGIQGRIDIHGRFDRDRFLRAHEGWLSAGVDNISIHASGQGRGLDPQLDVLHSAVDALAGHLTQAPAQEAPR